MSLVSPADLGTHLYADIITTITRGDDTIVIKAINAAIQEVKMYLSRFDLIALFGDDSNDATVGDEYMKSLVKTVACWHLLQLCNAGADYAAYHTLYTDTVTTLKSISAGSVTPDGWPELPVNDTDVIAWSSECKRQMYF